LRSSNRNNNNPTNENNNIGFRVARPMGALPDQWRGAFRQKLAARTAVSMGILRPCRVQGPLGRPGCPRPRGQPKNTRPVTASRRQLPKTVAGQFLCECKPGDACGADEMRLNHHKIQK
jgi:hypothetical protein